MHLQTLHGRAIAGGYVSVTPPHVKGLLERHPFLRSIFEAEHSRTYPRDNAVPALKGLEALFSDSALGIGVVVVHKTRVMEDLREKQKLEDDPIRRRHFDIAKGNERAKIDECRAALRMLCGEPLYSDDLVEIFARPRK
jgi:hypothetical protein